MAMISDRDRETARRLPDEFLLGSGDPGDRTTDLVRQHWGSYDGKSRIELVQALVGILEDLDDPGANLTDGHRDLCEKVIVGWLSKR